MDFQEITDGLNALGFTSGFAIGNNPAEIILWENEAPQPTVEELESAAPAGAYQREYDAVSASRHAAYVAPNGSDAVFMKYQRGEATEQEWLDAVTAINDANPYPVKEKK